MKSSGYHSCLRCHCCGTYAHGSVRFDDYASPAASAPRARDSVEIVTAASSLQNALVRNRRILSAGGTVWKGQVPVDFFKTQIDAWNKAPAQRNSCPLNCE